MNQTPSSLSVEQASKITQSLRQNIQEHIFGQENLVNETLATFLAGGHILMTGAPGLAKTTLVRVVAKNLGLAFGRVQFTPDLLPSDIVGAEILNIDSNGKRSFEFAKGPVFVNLLLADEINRASPRTQSAMLEAMQERNITAAGTGYQLPNPFMVFATQNPYESEGTFPLPEAQLDRFLIHSLVEFPKEDAELKVLKSHAQSELIGEGKIESYESKDTLTPSQVQELLATVKKVHIPDELLEVINKLVRATRPDDQNCPQELQQMIWYGAGPRAGISLISAAKATALMEGQESVRWHHIKSMARPVLRHRMKLIPAAARDQISSDDIIAKLLQNIESNHAKLAKGIS